MKAFYLTILAFICCFPAFTQKSSVTCGTSDEHLPKELLNKMARLPAIMESQRARTAAGEMRICRIGVEIDYPTFVRFDRDTNLISRLVLEDISKVSDVYEKEINTRVIVGNLRIWKDPNTDPFRISDNIAILLDVLNRLPAPAAGIDKRMYLYTKPLSGGYSGLANIAGMSNVSPFGAPQTIMHELGHNFSSPHTHSCLWPGGPIDACAIIEGDCYDKARENLGYKTGTIMSYCSSSPTFHPLCQAIMRDHADLNLPIIGSIPEPPKPIGSSNFTDGDIFIWRAVINALSYEVKYATHADLSDAQTVTTKFPGIQFKNQGGNITYYLSVRAINQLGASAWSEQVTLQVKNAKLAAPEIIPQPANESIAKVGTPYVLPYAAVPGASSYEIQITSYSDIQYISPFDSLTSANAGATYAPRVPTLLRWRVRAVNGQVKSKWSESGFFSINPDLNSELFLPFSQNPDNAPVRFPFRYNTMAYRSRTRVTVSKSSDFKNPVFLKEYTIDGGVLGVVSGLPANTQLYFKLEEWNEDDEYFPKRKTADVSIPFKTGNDAPSGSLTFMSEIDPKVFNDPYARIAIAEKSVWTTSRSYGYARIDQESLGFKTYTAKSTNGLIGYTGLTVSLQADEAQKIHILSEEGIFKIRKVAPVNDVPDNNASVTKFSNFMFIDGFIPSYDLYWSSEALYRQSGEILLPIKTVTGTAYIRQVVALGGKLWVLINSTAGGEVVVLDLASGKELDNISYNSRPELAWGIDEIAVNKEGHIMLKQQDFFGNESSISLWNNQKWTTFRPSAGNFPAAIRSVTTSPSGEFYVLTGGTRTGIYKYKAASWENLADIPVGDLANNLYPDLSNNIWLTGTYGIARLSLADFDLTVNNTDYCVKDSITAVVTANGKVNIQKPLTAIFTISTGGSINLEGLTVVNNQIRIKIPDDLAGTSVSLQLKATEPEMLTKSKRELSIHALPTATIVTDKTSMIPDKDTAVVTITLTGASPWSFKLWDNERASSESASYARKFVLAQPTDFELKISELSDKFCTTGTVKNSIKVIANVVTGNEPALPGVSIYPNPSNEKLTIRYENYAGKAPEYFISDARGSIVSSLRISRSVTEWDIRDLPAGIYLLWTIQNGSKRSWKIVKN